MQNVLGNWCTRDFGILMYHRVAEICRGLPEPTWNVTPTRLREQLSGLLTRGFEAWPLSKFIDAHQERASIPARAFAVTFDDGYANNYHNALPILRELKVPATIFLATKYLDTDGPFPFDDWSEAGGAHVPEIAWRPLTTDLCRELLDSGLIEFGGHTHSHERFRGRCDAFFADLQKCFGVLHDRFGIRRPLFAFPFGDYDAAMIAAATNLGAICALTGRQHRATSHDDPSEWGRFGVEQYDTPAVIAAKLSGWYTAVAEPGRVLKRSFASVTRRHRATGTLMADLSGEFAAANHANSQS
jgi:peptidoglycan/xylan/chitin deacetylase (PgdA/CDA1 family)